MVVSVLKKLHEELLNICEKKYFKDPIFIPGFALIPYKPI
jgi:hypothetical protein